MIHPSYVELMQVVNSDQTEIGEEPVINSRYSIVIATAKRARQIIGGDEPMITKAAGRKPLSVAVQELYEGKVKIVGEDDMADKVNEESEGSETNENSGISNSAGISEITQEYADHKNLHICMIGTEGCACRTTFFTRRRFLYGRNGC